MTMLANNIQKLLLEWKMTLEKTWGNGVKAALLRVKE